MFSHKAQGQQSRAGFLLAGGKSSRMGADKAFLAFDGQTLLERALALLGTVCDTVTIVGEPAKFSEYTTVKSAAAKPGTSKQEPVVADIFPGCGPLAGIHAALTHSTATLNLMLAVDMPFVSQELLAFLLTAAEEGGAVITVPRTSRGLQPLCAVYRPQFLTVAEQALRAGSYKIDAAFRGVSIHEIDVAELAAAGFTERCFFNVNTPADRLAVEGGDFDCPS
jgi:molybdopterin-guanine dinucleotide biosynthesis protein A